MFNNHCRHLSINRSCWKQVCISKIYKKIYIFFISFIHFPLAPRPDFLIEVLFTSLTKFYSNKSIWSPSEISKMSCPFLNKFPYGYLKRYSVSILSPYAYKCPVMSRRLSSLSSDGFETFTCSPSQTNESKLSPPGTNSKTLGLTTTWIVKKK